MGIFGSFKQAKQVVKDAKKDVKRKPATVTNINTKQGKKQQGGSK